MLLVNVGADKPGARHREVASAGVHPGPVYLRVTVDEKAFCHFAWSQDNQTFTPIGEPVLASVDRWVGAKSASWPLPMPAPQCPATPISTGFASPPRPEAVYVIPR